jgi:pantoate--beta-alanine ligase
MVIFKNADEIAQFLSEQKGANKTIGFVPTMGALHQGHLSLVEASKQQNDITVCSIFVNPNQFNNPEDFQHYPIMVEKDIDMLLVSECDVLFLPASDQVYPPGYVKKEFPLGKIETVLEGEFRPGHFQGVCQVMDRLLDIIEPHALIMGQKDYQQCMVIQKLIELKGGQYHLIVEPTVREEDGLAMSSRNLRLSEEDRSKAAVLSKALAYISGNFRQLPLKILKRTSREMLENEGFIIDYIEIVDAYTLDSNISYSDRVVALAAATIGGIRLIDNMFLN